MLGIVTQIGFVTVQSIILWSLPGKQGPTAALTVNGPRLKTRSSTLRRLVGADICCTQPSAWIWVNRLAYLPTGRWCGFQGASGRLKSPVTTFESKLTLASVDNREHNSSILVELIGGGL